uniref:Uncharacterized protein n=1 Tax=Pararge aegeria TaxID=116150 RepID=S4PXE1_9NEOP
METRLAMGPQMLCRLGFKSGLSNKIIYESYIKPLFNRFLARVQRIIKLARVRCENDYERSINLVNAFFIPILVTTYRSLILNINR